MHRAVGGLRWMSSRRPSPLLTVSPSRALIDEQLCIKGRFLPPHCPVTVCARMHSDDGDLWESFAHYTADADGIINLSRDHSVGGSYMGCEPMGLFWGMQPAPGGREGLRLRKTDAETPYVVAVSLLEGHVSPNKGQSTELTSVSTERWYMAPGVQRTEIRQNGLVGTLFLPSGQGPFPAVLDLWGMGGGLVEYRAALIASRGYASLSLAYLGHKDLPGPPNKVNVDDTYFLRAIQFLKDLPQVTGRVGIIGLSFGAFLTLRIATISSSEPSCIICINGPVGKSFGSPAKGGGLDDVKNHWEYDDDGNVSFKVVSMPENLSDESKVKIEDIECPLMYIEGGDDQNAAPKENADLIEEAMKAAGKSHLFTRLSYPGAGHLIEPPYAPNMNRSLWRVKPKKLYVLWGGQSVLHAAAQEDSWRKILSFLGNHLR